MTVDDLDAVMVIACQAFISPWSRRDFLGELRHPGAAIFVVEETAPERVSGFVCFRRMFGEIRLMNLAVDQECRGRGVGRRLLEAVIASASDRGIGTLRLEVRITNREAIGLYGRSGFWPCGRNPRYYADGEDALLMERKP